MNKTVTRKGGSDRMGELTAPMVAKDDSKRVVLGPVLVPDEPDSDDDVVTAEEIEEVAHKFMEEYGNIDVQHSLNNVGKTIESYLAPMDMEFEKDGQVVEVPKGSWMMGVRVTNDKSWEAVKDGNLNGFSIMGIPKSTLKSKYNNSLKNAADNHAVKERTTLNDIGDFEVNAVSLVDEPAVPKAKWVAIKSKGHSNEVIQKALEGSIEQRRMLVEAKMDEVYWNDEQMPIVYSVLEDTLVMQVINEESVRFVQVEYRITEDGDVEFVGSPQEVRIEENVIPVTNPSNQPIQQASTLNSQGTKPVVSNKAITDVLNQSEEAQKSAEQDQQSGMNMFEKALAKMGFASSEKAGRQISESSYRKLKEAKKNIDELFEQAQNERSNKSAQKEEGDMTEEETKQLIEDTLDERMKPIGEKLEEISATLSGDGEGNNEDEGNEEEDEENGGSSDKGSKKGSSQETVPKSEYDEKVEELERLAQKRAPLSKRLAGQDGGEPSQKSAPEPARDPFGYKK